MYRYTSWELAKKGCDQDRNCKAIYDYGCNGTYYTRSNTAPITYIDHSHSHNVQRTGRLTYLHVVVGCSAAVLQSSPRYNSTADEEEIDDDECV